MYLFQPLYLGVVHLGCVQLTFCVNTNDVHIAVVQAPIQISARFTGVGWVDKSRHEGSEVISQFVVSMKLSTPEASNLPWNSHVRNIGDNVLHLSHINIPYFLHFTSVSAVLAVSPQIHQHN